MKKFLLTLTLLLFTLPADAKSSVTFAELSGTVGVHSNIGRGVIYVA